MIHNNKISLVKFNKTLSLFFGLFIGLFSVEGIKAQELTKADTSNVHFLNSRKFFIYKVDKGETLFRISQKFKIPQEEILEFNHEIQKTGLKYKMKLWIPAYSWLKKDTIVVKEAKKPDNDILQVAIITNFNLPKIDTQPDTSESYIDEPLNKEVKENLEFVEGVLLAAEKFSNGKNKQRTHLYIVDSESDTVKLTKKLKKYSNLDLIITNESGNALKCISNYSKDKNLKLFSCGTNTVELIKDNKSGFSLLPSSTMQCEQAGEFAGKYFPNSSLITIRTNMSRENERSENFISGWKISQGQKARQIDITKSGSNTIGDSLEKEKTNIIFISSSNEDLVSSILNSLKGKIPDYNVRVIGLPTWQYFETIDQHLIEICNVYLFNSGFIDFNSQDVYIFRKYFRDRYSLEPSEISYQGYDAFLIAGECFLENGRIIFSDDKSKVIKGLFSDYTFTQAANANAYENRNIHVFQPTNDISIDLVKNFKAK